MVGQVLTIFFHAPGTRPVAVLVSLVFASLAGGLSLASLVPLFGLAGDGGAASSDSAVSQVILGMLALLGLEAGIGTLVILVVTAFALKNLLTLLAMLYVGNTTAHVSTALRSQMITSLLGVRWRYLTSQPMGRFANAVSVDATRAGNAYLASAQFVANALQAIVYIALAFFVSWQLSLLAFATGVVIALALYAFVRMARRAGVRQTRRTRDLVTYLTDALNSIKPLKAMARQEGIARLLERKIQTLRKALRQKVLSKHARRNLEETLTIASAGALLYATVAVLGRPIGEMLVMGVLLIQTLRNVNKVQEFLQQAAVLEAPYRAVVDIIEEAERDVEPLGDGAPPTFEHGARLAGVDFSFGDTAVLRQVDLDVPRGSVTVLTGASGAGKTTITDLLLGLYEPDAGQVLIDGVPLSELDKAAWRSMVGYVPQELILFHDTIYANVALGDPAIGESDARAALEVAGAWEFVAEHPDGLMAVVGEKGAKLSGGQRQRIALARALAVKPRLLILDEVTSALDPETERDLCRRIKALSRDLAVLAVTHRASLLEIADRVHHLEGGRLSENVAPATLGVAQLA